jgi:hypothetical protein
MYSGLCLVVAAVATQAAEPTGTVRELATDLRKPVAGPIGRPATML